MLHIINNKVYKEALLIKHNKRPLKDSFQQMYKIKRDNKICVIIRQIIFINQIKMINQYQDHYNQVKVGMFLKIKGNNYPNFMVVNINLKPIYKKIKSSNQAV